jgi:hypothetical protein
LFVQFLSLREEYKLIHGRAYVYYRVEIEGSIKSTRKPFLVMRIWRWSVSATRPLCISKVVWHLIIASASVVSTLKSVYLRVKTTLLSVKTTILSVKTTLRLSYRVLEMPLLSALIKSHSKVSFSTLDKINAVSFSQLNRHF